MDGTRADVGVAGDTLNTAIYLRRMAPELDVDYITCLGDDPFSDRIMAFIADAGVGTEPIAQIAGASPGLYAITTSPAGERSFTYWRSAAAARQLFADHDFSVLASYDAIYLSGISMAILPHDVRLALIDWLGRNDVTLVYDSNYRPRLWESTERARTVTRAMWQRADIALPSIDDEMDLFDTTAEAVNTRFATHKGKGALKRGDLGPLSLGTPVTQDYPPAPRVVDTTAAGDSFNAGYLAAHFTGQTQADALLSGHRLAAKVVGQRGAIIPQ